MHKPTLDELLDEPREIVKLETFVPYRIAVLSSSVSKSVADLYSDRFSISITEWRTIAVLGNYQPLSANEICERTNLDKVQVSRAVTRLTNAGLLLRRTDKSDRRKAELRLSARGMRIYHRIVPLALAWEERFLSVLDEEEKQTLNRLLDKLEAQARALKQWR